MQGQVYKFIKNNKAILLIVFLAIILRFVGLSSNPPSLNWDEVSHGYNAYSILKTGRDEWGKFFPVIFRAYGDYKLPVYIYAVTISEAIFGPNAFAVRFPSALAGVATVVFTYLLVLKLASLGKLGKSANLQKSLALLAGFLVAVEPWSLFLSRGAFEANFAQSLIVAGVYFFLCGLEKNKNLMISLVLFGLSIWTYNSARVFVPLFLLTLIILFKVEIRRIWQKDKKLVTCCLFLAAFFFLPMFWQLLNPAGQARYGKVAIIDEGTVGQIIQARNDSSLHPTLTRLIHNRPTYFISRFTRNYLSHFSPVFLFFQGGSHYQFSLPDHGLLYLISLPLFYLGLAYLVFGVLRHKCAQLILGWLLIAPVASSLTNEAPHVLRSITYLPIPMVITSLGMVSLLRILNKRKLKLPLKPIAVVLCFIIFLFFLGNYLLAYFTDYRSKYSWSWQYGYKQVVNYVKQNYDDYDKFIVTKKYGEPHEFFLFYWGWSPVEFRTDPNLIRFYQSDWYWVDRFDKLYFVNDWDIPSEEWENFVLESGEEFNCENQECLLITSPANYPKGWLTMETVNFLDGKPAFEMLEKVK
jgi:4-amino-4-deoxy-L-arabinose transferase-like glycosyltransferase